MIIVSNIVSETRYIVVPIDDNHIVWNNKSKKKKCLALRDRIIAKRNDLAIGEAAQVLFIGSEEQCGVFKKDKELKAAKKVPRLDLSTIPKQDVKKIRMSSEDQLRAQNCDLMTKLSDAEKLLSEKESSIKRLEAKKERKDAQLKELVQKYTALETQSKSSFSAPASFVSIAENFDSLHQKVSLSCF